MLSAIIWFKRYSINEKKTTTLKTKAKEQNTTTYLNFPSNQFSDARTNAGWGLKIL